MLKARVLLDTGRAEAQLAVGAGDAAALEAAEHWFRDAAATARDADAGALEAEADFRLTQSMYFRWTMNPDTALFQSLLAQFEATMQPFTSGKDFDPVSARYLVRTASIAFDLAQRQNTPAALSDTADITGILAEIFDRQRFPLIWAETRSMQGRIALEWDQRFGDPRSLEAALQAFDDALDIFGQANNAGAIGDATWQKALTLAAIGEREPQTAHLEQALAMMEDLAASPPVEPGPAFRRLLALREARVRAVLGARNGDADMLAKAVAGLRELAATPDPQADPQFSAQTDAELGKALYWSTGIRPDDAMLREAVTRMGSALERYRAWNAPQANIAPYTFLSQQYAGAAAMLAETSHAVDDLDTAIAAGRELHGLLGTLGDTAGQALAANNVAYMALERVRADFDADLLAQAAQWSDEALASVDAAPQFAGYFTNTSCEIHTEQARHGSDLALARSALEQCRSGLDLLRSAGDPQALATAEASVARATALVSELGGD